MWAYLTALLIAFYLFIGWWGARIATNALPPRDPRHRPSDEAIAAACDLLNITLPATDAEIRAAERKFFPRCIGDHVPDEKSYFTKMAGYMDAADLLISANAFDANPPIEARYYVAYWEHRAGLLGRLWGAILPPKALSDLRAEAAVQP